MSSRSHPLNSTDTTKMEKIMSDLMKNNDELPEGWEWKRLGEIAEVVAGNPAPQGEEYFRDGRYPFLRVQDMGRLGNDSYIYKTHDYINDKAVQSLRLFPKGSVLFTKSGASTLLNQRAILGRDMFVVSHIAATIPHDGIMSEWLYYWLKTVDFNKLAHATTLPSLPLSKAKDIHIPIAPPVEQKLIVSEIEKQFSRLDEAVAALKRVRASLKRYKASVLKAAVEGKLTEEWRKENVGADLRVCPDSNKDRFAHTKYETGADLLKRILAERKKKWEEANPKKKYKEPSAPDTSSLPELPKGWVWATVGALADNIHYGYTASSTTDTVGPKLLRITDIQNNTVKWDAVPYCKIEPQEKQKYLLKDGDLVFARTGATVGKSFLIKGNISEAVFASYLIRIILSKHTDKRFIYDFFQSLAYWMQIHKGKIGIGQPNVNAQTLSQINLPLPPLIEQQKIVEEIESRLSVAEEVEEAIDINLKRAERLRQAILKKAFSGRLI